MENGLSHVTKGSERKGPAIPQGEVKQRDYPVLQRRVEIDEQVAARDQVEPGERRVLDEVVHREDAHLAHVLGDAVAIAVLHEKALEPLGRYAAGDRLGITSSGSHDDGQ